MKSAQFLTVVDEAIGSVENPTVLSAIYRQLLKSNNVDDVVLGQRLDALLDKFPSPSVGREAMRQHVLAQLSTDVMSWEAFTLGMKIVGASTIIIKVD
jgi:hypothetical protein